MMQPVAASARSDRLLGIRSAPIVEGLMSVRSESSGPFAVRFPAYRHAKFVAVLRGRFDLQVDGETSAIRLRRGDCYVLTDGRAYRIFNADVPETEAAMLYAAERGADRVVRWGDGVVDTVTIGSRATFDPKGAAWLRGRLAPVIRLPSGTAEAARFRATLTLLCGEPGQAPGTAFAADRYVGILLVQVLRCLLAGGDPVRTGSRASRRKSVAARQDKDNRPVPPA